MTSPNGLVPFGMTSQRLMWLSVHKVLMGAISCLWIAQLLSGEREPFSAIRTRINVVGDILTGIYGYRGQSVEFVVPDFVLSTSLYRAQRDLLKHAFQAQNMTFERNRRILPKWREIIGQILNRPESDLIYWVSISCWRYGYADINIENRVTVYSQRSGS